MRPILTLAQTSKGTPGKLRDIYGMVAIVLYRYREHRAGASIPK